MSQESVNYLIYKNTIHHYL